MNEIINLKTIYTFFSGGGELLIKNINNNMKVDNYQRIIKLLFITSFLTQKHLNFHLKWTTSEKSAEMCGEGNGRQLCVGHCCPIGSALTKHPVVTEVSGNRLKIILFMNSTVIILCLQ